MLIYGLIDPRDSAIRYVGMTTGTARRRLARHMCPSNDDDSYRSRWLRQLRKKGLRPTIVILERCGDRKTLAIAEIAHIDRLRKHGARLTNTSPGGDAGSGPHTTESRHKISAALKGKKRTEAHCHNLSLAKLGSTASAETRAKLSAMRKGVPHGPMSHAIRLKIRDGKGGCPIIDQYGQMYQSQNEIARKLGLNLGHINEVIHGTRRSTGGFIFKMIREFPEAA